MDPWYALSLMVVGWLVGFGFGWWMRDMPRHYATALCTVAVLAAMALSLGGLLL